MTVQVIDNKLYVDNYCVEKLIEENKKLKEENKFLIKRDNLLQQIEMIIKNHVGESEMFKKKFNVLIRSVNGDFLDERTGFFIKLKDIEVFIHYSVIDKEWKVTDLNTGYVIVSGSSIVNAKNNFYKQYDKFIKYQNTNDYRKLAYKYRKLLFENELL